MSIFNYNTTGSIRVGNCATTMVYCNLKHLFPERAIVYSRTGAKFGELEKIYIKKVRFPKKCNYSCLISSPIYIDNYNKIHNEEDLLDLESAKAMIKDYIDTRNKLAEDAVLDC